MLLFHAPPPPAPCARVMVVEHAGPGVRVVRDGKRVKHPRRLRAGDRFRMPHDRFLILRWRGNRYVFYGARGGVVCARTLAPKLSGGVVRIEVRSRFAGVVHTPNALVRAPRRGKTVVRRGRHLTKVRPGARAVQMADLRHRRLRVRIRPPEKGLMDQHGLRLNTYPFAVSARQHVVHGLPPYWRDGRSCSAGCHAPGARRGWPLRPFHRQHSLRAGLNELRPANFHVGIDIQARDGQRVYPMSSGRVHVVQHGGPDERVQVGRFVYWHIEHRVHEGQYVRKYHTSLGRVKRYYHHLHLSEVIGDRYINPLRPGRNLRPWHDSEPPVIGRPRIGRGGRVRVGAFDPQSYVVRIVNVTPVLAPAALAWRLYDARGRRVTGLEWALRGSQHLPDGLKRVVYTPRARNPGFSCFTHHRVCIPTWDYRLAGGLTPRLPRLRRGRYRLAVYAWDWAGNTSVRSLRFRVRHRRHAGPRHDRFAPLHPRADVQ